MDSSPSETPDFDPLAPPRRSRGPIRLVIAVVILAAAVIGVGGVMKGRARNAWLVNGLEQSYAVTIDGARHALAPFGSQEISVGEGSHVIEFESLTLPPQTVTIETRFLTRLFDQHTFVINPDRAAVIIWEQTGYSASPAAASNASTAPSRVQTDQLLHHFEDVDFVFRPFPEQIEVPDRQEVVFRDRVDVLNQYLDLPNLAGVVADEIGTEAAAAMIERRLDAVPGNALDIQLYSVVATPERFQVRAEAHLARRPVEVEWHRAFQEVTEQADPGLDLVAHYRALVDAEPDVAALRYLLGRVTTDPDEADALFRKAASGPDPTHYAHAALAYGALINGGYAEAKDEIDRFIAANDGDAGSFAGVEREALHGLGQFEALLDRVGDGPPRDAAALDARTYLLARLGRADEARLAIDTYVVGLGADDSDPMQLRDALLANLTYAEGDLEGFTTLARAQPELGYASDAALLSGDLAGAVAQLDAAERSSPVERLLLGALASLAGNEELAAGQYDAALANVVHAPDDAWVLQVVGWIQAGTPPDDAATRGLELMPQQKRSALAALGAAFPEERDRYWTLARALDYDFRWPHLTVARIVGGG